VLTLGERVVFGATYLHSYELGVLMGRSQRSYSDVTDILEAKDLVISYLRDHIALDTPSGRCTIDSIYIDDQDGYDILSKWLRVDYSFMCPGSIDGARMLLDIFTEFDLQTNRLTILDTDGKELYYKVATARVPTVDISLSRVLSLVDSDWDGLPDEEEKIYKTDVHSRDTDNDYYTDSEEVYYGWNPLSPLPSPGQSVRTRAREAQISPPRSIEQTHSSYDLSGVDTSLWSALFPELLREIGNVVRGESQTSFFWVFFAVFGLWFLHALGPGHAKGLLASIMVHKKSGFMTGLRFITLFSLVHILDILLLYLLIRVALTTVDSATVLSIIQKCSSLLLVILGVYLFFGNHDSDEDDYWKKKTWILAIIAGLAPCTFGWSIFFLLMSLGKMAWIPFLIAALALGIFVCLLVILMILTVTKKHAYHHFDILARSSVRISALFILIIWVYLSLTQFGIM
jgi:ABC-type nickel/cobalt efflux system permease component RcnA